MKKITDEIKEKITKLYKEDGYKSNTIADMLNISQTSVINTLKEKGIERVGRLSKEDKQKIIELYQQGISPKEIGEKFGIYNNSVTRILRKAGIERNQAATKITKDEEDYIIKQYQLGNSSEKIAKDLNRSGTTICRILKKNDAKIRPATENKRIYNINKNIFNDMNTEEMAYFYGMMLADGSIESRWKNSFKLSLHKNDADIVKKLSLLFYDQDRTKFERDQIYFVIYSKDLTKKLINLGCPPQKTFIVGFPDWLERKNYRHFVRGLIDGDGGIYFKRTEISITGNKLMISKIIDILKKELDIDVTLNKSHEKKNSYYLKITNKNCILKCANWLYDNATIYMNRKYKEAISILNNNDYMYKNTKPHNYGTTYIPKWNNTILTKYNIDKLSNNDKEKVARFLFDYYRLYDFPYPKYKYPSLDYDIRNLIKFEIESIKNNDDNLLATKNVGIKLFKHFANHFFEVRNKKMTSMLSSFYDDEKLLKVIKNRLGISYKETFNMSGNMLRQGFRNSYTSFAASTFKPTIAKYIYETYSTQNGIVYDFSMGFGQRLLGAITSKKALTYIGTDPWRKSYENISELTNFLSKNKSVNVDERIFINNLCSSDFFDSTLSKKIDVAFSSPPYFDTEIYEDNSIQAYYNGYNHFINVWWQKTVQNIYKLLKNNGFLAINLPNSYILTDMLNIVRINNFSKVKTYTINMSSNKIYRPNKEEYIIIFQKS